MLGEGATVCAQPASSDPANIADSRMVGSFTVFFLRFILPPILFFLPRFEFGHRASALGADRIGFFRAIECALFNTGFEFLRNGDAMHNFATRLFFGPRQNDVPKLKNVLGGVDHYVLHR
jgi:hypothetical protein